MATAHYEFVGEIPLDMLCGICLLVPQDPQRVTCCGRHFCQPCISEWMVSQHFQCPVCYRPNTTHHSDPALAQRIHMFPVYCTSRQKGCTWQGLIRDLELHKASDEGCQFSLVECPLAEYGCQPHSLQRRDLSKHMADKHANHMRFIIGNLKHTSSRLETQEREMEELRQSFLLFSSQVNSVLQAQSGLGTNTAKMQRELQNMKTKISELEQSIAKPRPPTLSHLDRALSDTFPPLRSFSDEGEGEGEGEEVSLNTSLLLGLREIEERANEVGGATDGEEAGLPVGGDLPTESAVVRGGEEEEGESVGVTVKDGEKKCCTDDSQTRDEREIDSCEPSKWTLTPESCPTALPSYATAVSNPFHLAMMGLSPVSKYPDSIPATHQSNVSHASTVTIADPVTMATTSTDTSGDHHGNGASFPINGCLETLETMATASTTATSTTATTTGPPPGFKTGQEGVLPRDGEQAIQLEDLLGGEGFGSLASCGPAGWGAGWKEATPTPRSDSSLSILSSSSSESSFVGDTVIQYGSSTVVVSTTSGKKSPSPDHTQVKLFVKYMPHCCSPEKAVSIFLVYGKVHLLEYHSEHRDKLFLIMDREAGLRAMSALNGTRLPGSPKPLSVQLYRSAPVIATPIVQRADSITSEKTLRLFVKHLGLEMSTQEITELFNPYGKVFDVQKHPNRRNVAFVYMCYEGGKRAITGLNGYLLHQLSKPLLVELSHEPTTVSLK